MAKSASQGMDVQAQITTLSEDKGFIKCFLGEFLAEEWGETGEEVTAETMDGSIHIWFDDEVGSQEKPKGFFKTSWLSVKAARPISATCMKCKKLHNAASDVERASIEVCSSYLISIHKFLT
jgi:hypothetical protein